MKKILFLSALLASLAIVSACGQKGPLYLPDAPPSTASGSAPTAPQQP